MKRFMFVMVVAVLAFSACGKGEVKPTVSKEEQVKMSLEKIFKYTKDANHEKLAEYILYRGKDETRNWKDIADYNDPFEKQQVQAAANIIFNHVDGAEYKFGKYETEEESEGEWNVIHVTFTKNEKENTVIFSMLLVNGAFRLGELNQLDN